MKKILLVGDSIRLGYDKFVKMAFEGVAEVVSPKENCRFSAYHIRYTRPWLEETDSLKNVPDVIHFNVGLWDCLHMPDGMVHTDVAQYKKNLERVVNLYKILVPSAKLIFALSTPVFDNPTKRLNCEIEQYNAAAIEVMQKHGIEVNDLYTLLKDAPESYHSDQTHYYTSQGSRVITEKVVSVIENATGVTGKKLNYNKLFDIPEEIIGV